MSSSLDLLSASAFLCRGILFVKVFSLESGGYHLERRDVSSFVSSLASVIPCKCLLFVHVSS